MTKKRQAVAPKPGDRVAIKRPGPAADLYVTVIQVIGERVCGGIPCWLLDVEYPNGQRKITRIFQSQESRS